MSSNKGQSALPRSSALTESAAKSLAVSQTRELVSAARAHSPATSGRQNNNWRNKIKLITAFIICSQTIFWQVFDVRINVHGIKPLHKILLCHFKPEHSCCNLKINIFFDRNEAFVYADYKQLLRVFNNILRNSEQAIESNSEGIIDIDIITEEENYLIKISDNGIGINHEDAAKIFSPNFTTKTGGTVMSYYVVNGVAYVERQDALEAKDIEIETEVTNEVAEHFNDR